MQISTRAVELVDNDRKKIIIERSKEILKLLSTITIVLEEKLLRSEYLYRKKYNDNLSVRELTILYLYIIFPNDENFINMLNNTNYDFDRVGRYYAMSGTVTKLRYDCYMSLKDTKKLKLK